MFKNEVIDRYMHCRILKNTQVSILVYSLADLNIGQCVELTFFKGKLGGFFVLKVLKSSNELKTILIRLESTFTSQNAINLKKLHFKKVNIRSPRGRSPLHT